MRETHCLLLFLIAFMNCLDFWELLQVYMSGLQQANKAT